MGPSTTEDVVRKSGETNAQTHYFHSHIITYSGIKKRVNVRVRVDFWKGEALVVCCLVARSFPPPAARSLSIADWLLLEPFVSASGELVLGSESESN